MNRAEPGVLLRLHCRPMLDCSARPFYGSRMLSISDLKQK
jgi:hypothetical protein